MIKSKVTAIGVIKVDTRSLDYGSCRPTRGNSYRLRSQRQ